MYPARSAEEVYRWLTQKLGRQPRADLWKELLEDRLVGDVLDAQSRQETEELLSELLKRYKLQNERYPMRRRNELGGAVARQLTADDRLAYLAHVLAMDAAEEPRVVQFRKEVLDDHLLTSGEVDSWIRARADEEGTSVFLNNYPLTVADVAALKWSPTGPAGSFLVEHKNIRYRPPWRLGGGPHLEFVQLAYRVKRPDQNTDDWIAFDDGLQTVPVRHGGSLHWLLELSKYLAERYCWDEADAATFILTGNSVPGLAMDSIITHKNRLYPALNYVEMRFPIRLSPRDVAALYESARAQYADSGFFLAPTKRDRPMTKKHLTLGVFARSHRAGTLAQKMAQWNKEHPEWKYEHATVFGRDLKNAYERLVGRRTNGSSEREEVTNDA